jgi:hypothetical protein
MRLHNRLDLRAKSSQLWLLSLFLLAALSPAAAGQAGPATASAFRWIEPTSDPQLWQQVQTGLRDELTPDEPKPGLDAHDVYGYKYLERVGIVGHSALVIISARPSKVVSKDQAWNTYSSAFNFDLNTQRKSSIERAEHMWIWKFNSPARFGPSRVPDVTFNYVSCTECEFGFLFGSFSYDDANSAWRVRSWGEGKDLTNELLVGVSQSVYEVADAAGDRASFDCAYGFLDSSRPGFQDFAIRCKEFDYTETGRTKLNDSTLLYSLSDGQFKARRITDDSEVISLTAKVCRPNSDSWLCKLPPYMTMTEKQNAAIDAMFPDGPMAWRELAHFRNLKRSMSMSAIVRKCGVPDEVGGSGIMIFIYHLFDSSLVVIGATGATGPILYANHLLKTGKSFSLISAK